jgi:hypothetical protein
VLRARSPQTVARSGRQADARGFAARREPIPVATIGEETTSTLTPISWFSAKPRASSAIS